MSARAIGLGLASWVAAAALHPLVPRDAPAARPPSAVVLAVATGGKPTAAATAAWSTSVLHQATGAADPHDLERGILMARTFDGSFQTPAVHGALLLRRAGAAASADRILRGGASTWPEEAFFPWALGMHAWLDGRLEEAATHLDRAAMLDPSPVHHHAAESLRER